MSASIAMSATELDEVRRWAEQRTNPDDGATTVAETYLRLLATVEARDEEIARLLAISYQADIDGMNHCARADHFEARVTQLDEEIARLSAMYQQTHGVHHSWVADDYKLRARLAQLESALQAVANEEDYRVPGTNTCPICGHGASRPCAGCIARAALGGTQ